MKIEYKQNGENKEYSFSVGVSKEELQNLYNCAKSNSMNRGKVIRKISFDCSGSKKFSGNFSGNIDDFYVECGWQK